MSRRVIYSRGFPFGAPLVMLRGGGLKVSGVKGYLMERGFRWNPGRYAWETYMDKEDFTTLLLILRDSYGCEIHAKNDLDPNYILDVGTMPK
jgi:hypothetical protein